MRVRTIEAVEKLLLSLRSYITIVISWTIKLLNGRI